MRISFFTNFINHHQVPLADELYKLLGDEYRFVSFEPIPDEFLRRGYPDYSDRPYHIKGYLPENAAVVKALAEDSDILLHSACDDKWVVDRVIKGKHTIRYTERFNKLVDSTLLHPYYWKSLYEQHTRYRNKNLYMLAASGYGKFDAWIIGSYPNKVYKWAYFTSVPIHNINEILEKKRHKPIEILWVATICNVKRPELVVELASKLKQAGYNAKINMVGSGGLEEEIRYRIAKNGVEDYISLLGNIPNDKVLKMMQSHHIFVFTSDYGEGWGAVVNEAMSNGCAIVSSDSVGAAPFLIKNGVNGFTFRSGNSQDLFCKVKRLCDDYELRERFASEAYHTMVSHWTPKIAAHNFVTLCQSILKGKKNEILDGPCSVAKIIWPNLSLLSFSKKIFRRVLFNKPLNSI